MKESVYQTAKGFRKNIKNAQGELSAIIPLDSPVPALEESSTVILPNNFEGSFKEGKTIMFDERTEESLYWDEVWKKTKSEIFLSMVPKPIRKTIYKYRQRISRLNK
jgi:hypothetical protein